MQPSHRRCSFDVDRILISECSALHAQDEAERLDMAGQVCKGERGLFTLVEIAKLEALEVADQDIARSIPLGQAVKIRPGLPVGASKIPSPRSFVPRSGRPARIGR